MAICRAHHEIAGPGFNSVTALSRTMNMKVIHVKKPEHIEAIRELFREYEAYLGVDLCFQGFESELSGLPGKYSPPQGALLLATDGKENGGCVAVRDLGTGFCEMKRLYVRPQYRGQGLGKTLALAVIYEAIRLGYSAMRLDTLEHLKEAMRLYEALGFRRVSPYYHNPLPGVVYWELDLKGVK